MTAHFKVPLNLPHASTIMGRIGRILAKRLSQKLPDHGEVWDTAARIFELLEPFGESGENPPAEEEARVRADAAMLARSLVDGIERLEIGEDRLGQCVRNLFECLELGEEGAEISLRAGEDPDSLLRPE